MSVPQEPPNTELSLKDIKLKSTDAHIAEYNSLRAEILVRLQSQGQAFSYLVTALAATVGGITYLMKENRYDLIPELGLFLPLVVAPLAFIFFDNELMIFRNGFLIHKHLKHEILQNIGQNVFLLEERGTDLGRFNIGVHRILSFGRWLLFVLPVLGPIVYALGDVARWSSSPAYTVILILDCLVAGVLLLAIGAGVLVQGRWRSLSRALKGGTLPPAVP